jgi:hypothetical protein
MSAPRPIKNFPAGANHQAFYVDIVDAMMRHKIPDSEAVAIFGRMLGYHIAVNDTATQTPELVAVFRHNIRAAVADIKEGRVVPGSGS